MKYDDGDEPYLMLGIKQTNNWQCCQYFHNDNIRKVLEHFNEKRINLQMIGYTMTTKGGLG